MRRYFVRIGYTSPIGPNELTGDFDNDYYRYLGYLTTLKDNIGKFFIVELLCIENDECSGPFKRNVFSENNFRLIKENRFKHFSSNAQRHNVPIVFNYNFQIRLGWQIKNYEITWIGKNVKNKWNIRIAYDEVALYSATTKCDYSFSDIKDATLFKIMWSQ